MDEPRLQRRRRSDSLEEGLDRLVSAGRQLVDGVSGARPGSRPASRAAAPLPRLGDLGRWVETQLDGLLDDDDDWRESWEQPQPARGRRPLEAISRRGSRPSAAAQEPIGHAEADGATDWPDAESFSVRRWRRDPLAARGPDPLSQPLSQPNRSLASPAGRPLPRSSRRRAS